MNRDLPKNDIPLLVLAVLADGARHGYAIAREIERRSENALTLREGSLYPALRVLEQDGYIAGDWEIPASGPAKKVYSLTDAGRAELAERARTWERYANTVGAILNRTPQGQPT